MAKIDDHLQSHSALPLLSKPHQVDSYMKHIKRNPNLSSWRRYIFSFGKKNQECEPLNETVLKGNNKSYLLDRIKSLEDRLIQLSLEIEARRTLRASDTTSTFSGPRELPVSLYPVFNNPKPKCKDVSSDELPISTDFELQKRPRSMEEKQKNGKSNGDDKKTFKNGKKKAHSWPHLKMLGC